MPKGHPTTSNASAFTLIELMLVVMITSILAAIALPSMSNYVKDSKKSEARLNLRKMYDGEVAYFYEEHTTREGKVLSPQFVHIQPWNPDNPGANKRLGNWETPGWRAIKFNPGGPVLYSYWTWALDDGDTGEVFFVVGASGDLNEDGWVSTYERVGWFNPWNGNFEASQAIYGAEETPGVNPWGDGADEGEGEGD